MKVVIIISAVVFIMLATISAVENISRVRVVEDRVETRAERRKRLRG